MSNLSVAFKRDQLFSLPLLFFQGNLKDMQGKRLKSTLPLTRLSNMCLNSSSHKTAMCPIPFFFFFTGDNCTVTPVTTNVALLRMMVVVQEPIEGIVRLFFFYY